MKIYTRTGDEGLTSLFSGERVEKDDLRIEAYGTVDELNSLLGVAGASCQDPVIREIVSTLQNQLFVAGADLATRPGSRREVPRIVREDWQNLESRIDTLEAQLPKLKNFVLPAGTLGAASLQFARSVCRRAERLAFHLRRDGEDVNPELLVFLNRLSDLLFTMARYENMRDGGKEIPWTAERH